MADEDLNKLKIDKSKTFSGRSRSKKNVVWLLIALLLLAGFSLYATGVFSPAVEVEVVTVSQVYPSLALTLLNASGYVVAQRKAAVASKITGRLEWLGVEEGSRVREGEVIARLENLDVVATRNQTQADLARTRTEVAQAEAELHEATLNYRRLKQLLAEAVISQSEFDPAEARYRKAEAAVMAAKAAVRSAEAALQGAEVSVDYTLIRAPFDAVVLTKDADIGDIVTPIGAAADAKAAVVNIADLDSLQVEADVSESNLSKVYLDQPCEIQLDALPNQRFAGAVHMIVPTADRTKATVLVKVRFFNKDPGILPEMSARVAFLERPLDESEKRSRTAIDQAAVVDRDGQQLVYRLDRGQAVATPVKTGERLDDMVEITSGIKAGDKVVIRPLGRIKDGTRVKLPGA